jgi:hypothetical protein
MEADLRACVGEFIAPPELIPLFREFHELPRNQLHGSVAGRMCRGTSNISEEFLDKFLHLFRSSSFPEPPIKELNEKLRRNSLGSAKYSA